MNDRPQIVLHVGAPKTGSTYLQKRMRLRVDIFRAAGIYVPVLPEVERTAGNAKLLATALSREPSLSFQRAFPELLEKPLDPRQIVADLSRDWRPEHETMILSAENFRPDHIEDLRALLPSDARVVVVLFVRRQDVWIESYFNQLTKSADLAMDLPRFVTMLCETDGERFCRPDWYATYRAWSAAFPCRVVSFETARIDLWSAFADAAGLRFPSGIDEIDAAQVSLDAHELAYLLELDPRLSFSLFARRRGASARAARELEPAPRVRFLSDVDHDRVRARFEASNTSLCATLGWSPDALAFVPPRDAHVPLEALYATPAYRAHRALADRFFEESLANA